jgi:hypothetical protein
MFAASNPPAPPEPPGALDQDAYCPGCGYNVRGLAGDPIRCPECGNRYARAELRWPKQRRVMTRLERCQRNLKANADICAAATIPGLFALLVLALGGRMLRELVAPLAVTSALIWLLGFALFARRCRGLRGWPRALATYHVTAAPAMLVNLLLVSMAWILVGGLCGLGLGSIIDALRSDAEIVVASLLLVGAVAALGLLLAWLAVRLDPMRWLKRQGADRLNALAQQLADRTPT